MKKIIIISLLSLFITTILKAQTSLKLDHIFILIDTTNNIHQKFAKVGLTPAEEWKILHSQQGTTGEFFLFLNFYISAIKKKQKKILKILVATTFNEANGKITRTSLSG